MAQHAAEPLLKAHKPGAKDGAYDEDVDPGNRLFLWPPCFAHPAAAPVPPELTVNHGSWQCATIFARDECVSAVIPDGSEMVEVEPLLLLSIS